MRVTSVESTELFTGTPEKPLQVVGVRAEHIPGRPVPLTVEGPGVRSVGELRATAGEDGTVRAEVPLSAERLAPGDRRRITVEERAFLGRPIRSGRVAGMGGAYNEPALSGFGEEPRDAGRMRRGIEVDAPAVEPGAYRLMAKVAWHGSVAHPEAVVPEETR
jgi:hypothetical protein